MTLNDVRSHYDYNEWATARLVGVMAGLDERQLTAPLVSSFPTILTTFGHIVAGESIWLSRLQGTSPTAFPEWLPDASFSLLRAKLAELESDRRALLLELSEEQLNHDLNYHLLSGEAHVTRTLDVLLHVVNHSTYHRGQLTTMLRQVGATPVSTDLIVFKREQSRGR
jgi:uncharacterized damage-inducible protein DinB